MSSELEVWLHDTTLGSDVRVGTLARTAGRGHEVIRFMYSPEWLNPATKRGFQIDPEIPLTPGAHYPDGGRLLHGVFRDTAPDRWGRVLMERREAMEAKAQKRPSKRLSEWDFLAGVNDQTRMGGLRLWDVENLHYVDDRDLGAPPAARLRELEATVRALDAEDAEERPEYEQWLRLLVVPGTSLGGARPKASFTAEDGSLWLAKFPANDDRRDVATWEYLAHELALSARIDVPQAKLMRFASRHHTFAVKRFDRALGARRLYASAMTLLQRNDGESGSYLEIAQALQQQGDKAHIANDLAQLYRRIVFSILIGNRDDHFRNHGFLRTATGWSLSPAFDINPNPDKQEHVLAIDESDPSPDTALLRATAAFYQLKTADAVVIENEVRAVVKNWRSKARALAISDRGIAQLARVIDETR